MLLWTDLASVVLTGMGAAAVVGLPLGAVAAAVLELGGRRQPWIIAVTVGLLGLLFGFALVATDGDTPFGALTLIVAAVMVGILIRNRQRRLAGWLLVTSCLPWAMFGAAVLLDGAVPDRLPTPGAVLVPLLSSLAGIAGGLWLILSRGRGSRGRPDAALRSASPAAWPAAPTHDAGSPAGPSDAPAAVRAWDAASRAAVGPSIFGMNAGTVASIVALLVGVQATVIVAHGRDLPEAIAVIAGGSLLTGVIAAILWAIAWPPRSRRSFEAFAWLGEADLARFRGLAGNGVAPTLENMRRYVRDTAERADDRWIRVEVLAANGELDAASDVAGRLPEDTPSARAERELLIGYVEWLRGGSARVDEVRAAVEAIQPDDGEDRLRGEVSLAIAEVRHRIALGDDDPAAALREARERIGRRADGILLVPARRLLPSYVRVAAIFTVVVALLDRALTVQR